MTYALTDWLLKDIYLIILVFFLSVIKLVLNFFTIDREYDLLYLRLLSPIAESQYIIGSKEPFKLSEWDTPEEVFEEYRNTSWMI